MHIENLNKSQLLLLTILVNFVVSIATGILTVSLLDEAPPIITQTVNRIVEHTIETIVPGGQAASVITKETTVVVKDEDLLIKSVAAQSARTVTLHLATTTAPALTTGVYLPRARSVATASSPNLPREVVVLFANGSFSEASFVREERGVALYGFSDDAKLPTAPDPALLPLKNLKAGQTVIALAESGVITGIISKVSVETISTTLPAFPKGSASVSSEGDIVGIGTGEAGTLLSADIVNALLIATSTPAQ